MGDTSFSQMKSNKYFKGDNRGLAASAVTLHEGKCRIRGYTESNYIVDYVFAPSGTEDGDIYIGKSPKTEDDKKFFVKAKLPVGPGMLEDSYIMCNVNFFTYEYTVMTKSKLKE